jgi:hypothetical protein
MIRLRAISGASTKETEMAAKTVKKGTKSTQTKGASTGLKKFLGQEAKMYEPRKKGTGKLKYQNVIKEARTDTKKDTKLVALSGKKLTKSEAQARNRKAENIAKQIDREEKVRKGVRTEKPSTKKVPVKPRGGGGMRGPINLGGGGGAFGKIK